MTLVFLFCFILFQGCVWPGRGRGKCPQILHECVRPGRKGKGRTLSEMKVERNKRFGFNLVDRRVSPRSLAEGVTLTCAKTVTKAPCAKATAPFSSDYTRPGREFNTFQAQKKK